MRCPNCINGKLYPAIPHSGFPNDGIQCDICSGTAQLPANVTYIPENGYYLKIDRIVRGLSLREEAIRLNMDVKELSLRERGYFLK